MDKKVPWKQFTYTKYEIYAGSVFMTTIDFFIVIACAATLYQDGIVVQSAEEAAMALVPFLGAAAQYLFAIGLLSVSILAAGVLPLATAYVVCEAFGFESGLDNSFREAPVFNGLITFLMFVPAAVAMIPGLPLVNVILVAQSLNGILLPVILIFTLLMINDPHVMGEHVNGKVRNVIAWGFTITLIGAIASRSSTPTVRPEPRAASALGAPASSGLVIGRRQDGATVRPAGLAGRRRARRGGGGGPVAEPAGPQPSSIRRRGSTCTSTSVLGMQLRMSSSMCSAMSCASVIVRPGSTTTCRSTCRRLPARLARSL